MPLLSQSHTFRARSSVVQPHTLPLDPQPLGAQLLDLGASMARTYLPAPPMPRPMRMREPSYAPPSDYASTHDA